MNILSIEKTRNELINFLENTSSRRFKAKRISEFFSLLIEQKSYSLIESYLLEFLPKYLDYLKTYSPIGVSPDFTKSIIQINTKLIEVIELTEYKAKLSQLNKEVEDKLFSLNKVLAGGEVGITEERKAFFPLIEDDEGKSINQTVGAVDSITIKLSKAKQKDKFIIVPSEAEKDKQLEEQINICWEKAKEFSNKYVRKLSLYHEVIISFDGNLGVYRGESLGAALTIAMIEELLRFYNSPTVLEPIMGTAFTGGISERGKVHKVSKDIVEKKVEICFYSNCKILAVPKEDETFVLNKLDELLKLHPKRNLRIVGVSDLEEILLRRDLVEIKKQKVIVKTGKFVKKNWVSAVVTVLLAVLFGYLFVMDWDDNPAILENEGSILLVKNKNRKLLWTRKLWVTLDEQWNYVQNNIAQVIDINNDGTKEVLICQDNFNDDQNDLGRISCYNYKGERIWKYTFKDTIRTSSEIHSSSYSIGIVQRNKPWDEKIIYCYASNHPLYPGVIFTLSAKNGERLDMGLWNTGQIANAMIGDFNKDDKLEIVAFGVHNGFNAAILFSVDADSLNGQTPTVGDYSFVGLETIRPKTLISFLPCDLTKYHNIRMNAPAGSTLMFDAGSEEFRFLIHEGIDTDYRSVHYRFDKNLKFLSVSPGNGFEADRDLLVRQGKLKPPRTNTQEYTKMLEDNIRYWKDGQWVKREELE